MHEDDSREWSRSGWKLQISPQQVPFVGHEPNGAGVVGVEGRLDPVYTRAARRDCQHSGHPPRHPRGTNITKCHVH